MSGDQEAGVIDQERFVPKYYVVKTSLIRMLRDGIFPPSTKFPSQRELARRYAIAEATAHKVIAELIRDGYIFAVPGKGCVVSAQLPRLGVQGWARRAVAFIAANVGHEYFSPMLKGLLSVVQPAGYRLEVYDSQNDPAVETHILSQVLRESVAGVIFAPSRYDYGYKVLRQMQSSGIPVVLQGRRIAGFTADYVGPNNHAGAVKQVTYLARLGHRRILFVSTSNPKKYSVLEERLEGYLEGLRKNSVPVDENLIQYSSEWEDRPVKPGEHRPDAYQRLRRYLKRAKRYTAVCGISDTDMLAAYHILREMGKRVPEDVSLIGFDNLREGQVADVPLTTVGYDTFEEGCAIGTLLVGRIAERSRMDKRNCTPKPRPIHRLIPVELIIRQSVKRLTCKEAVYEKTSR